MKPVAHHHSTTIANILLSLGAAALVVLFHEEIVALGINFTLAFFGSFILTSILFQSLVVPRIAANCPRCGGPSYVKGHKKYRCTRCGHVEDVHPWSRTGPIGSKIHEAADRNDKDK